MHARPTGTQQTLWKSFGIQPHRSGTFKFSIDPQLTDPQLEAKVRDIVGLYLDPPAKAIVLCVDEKSQIQALNRTAPMLPLRPGLPKSRTHDYVRHGTTTLFAALEVATGKRVDACYDRHRHQEFLRFLRPGRLGLPAARAARGGRQLRRPPAPCGDRLAGHASADHAALHPDPGSWLNLVEVFFGILTRQAIRRGTVSSVADLEAAIEAAIGVYIDAWNDRCQPFTWTKDADTILAKATAPKNRNTHITSE